MIAGPGPQERCEYEISAPIRGVYGPRKAQPFWRPCARRATKLWHDPNTGEDIRFCAQHFHAVESRGYL